MNITGKYKATISYIVFIVLINSAFVYLPAWSLFSQRISVADAFVGFIYIVRDFAQREMQHYVFIAMLIGALLSFVLASPAVAVASVSAFLVGEVVDWGVYTFTKRPLSSRLLWSACLSAPLDTGVFLYFTHRLDAPEFFVMTLGKIAGVLLLWLIWRLRNKSQHALKQPAILSMH